MSKAPYKKLYTDACRNETKTRIAKWVDDHPAATAEETSTFVRQEVKAFAMKISALQSKQAEVRRATKQTGNNRGW